VSSAPGVRRAPAAPGPRAAPAHRLPRSAPEPGSPNKIRKRRITAGRRAVIWPTYHVVSVPAIMGAPSAIAIVPWIFMQAIVSRERAHMPHTARSVRHGVAAYGTPAFECRRPPADWVALGRPLARPRAASLDHITVSNKRRPEERAPTRRYAAARSGIGISSVTRRMGARRVLDLCGEAGSGAGRACYLAMMTQ